MIKKSHPHGWNLNSDSASLVPGLTSNPSDSISLYYMDTHGGLFSQGTKTEKNANPCKGNSMVYLKQLYSRLGRQSSQLSTEVQQEHAKVLFL